MSDLTQLRNNTIKDQRWTDACSRAVCSLRSAALNQNWEVMDTILFKGCLTPEEAYIGYPSVSLPEHTQAITEMRNMIMSFKQMGVSVSNIPRFQGPVEVKTDQEIMEMAYAATLTSPLLSDLDKKIIKENCQKTIDASGIFKKIDNNIPHTTVMPAIPAIQNNHSVSPKDSMLPVLPASNHLCQAPRIRPQEELTHEHSAPIQDEIQEKQKQQRIAESLAQQLAEKKASEEKRTREKQLEKEERMQQRAALKAQRKKEHQEQEFAEQQRKDMAVMHKKMYRYAKKGLAGMFIPMFQAFSKKFNTRYNHAAFTSSEGKNALEIAIEQLQKLRENKNIDATFVSGYLECIKLMDEKQYIQLSAQK